MRDTRLIINAAMAALIDGQFGCLDAAAETINARNGSHVSKGTLSKRLGGHLDWPLTDILALEDAAGVRPVTRMLVRRESARDVPVADSILSVAGDVSREAGEAVSAALRATQSADAGDRTKAAQEAREARDAIEKLIAAIGEDLRPVEVPSQARSA